MEEVSKGTAYQAAYFREIFFLILLEAFFLEMKSFGERLHIL